MRYILLLCLLLNGMPQVSHAFYAWQGDRGSAELRGLLRGFGVILINPDNPFFYRDQHVSGLAGSGRLMLDADSGGQLSFETHAIQTYIPNTLQSGGRRFATGLGVERSDTLDWSFGNKQAHFLFDRLNVQYASDQLNIKLGRQPINLASTFYFTPNDFFAPFAAQTFFRDYKPGVDAMRVGVPLGDFSQFSLIAVLAYQPDILSDSGWSNRPDRNGTSYLVRASTVFGDFYWAIIGGVVRRDQILGGDFQGELFEWLGIRGEGHITLPDNPQQSSFMEISLGLEHRWESGLTLRFEQFYHGSGASSVNQYDIVAAGRNRVVYLARQYSAVGGSYELTPLLNSDVVAIHNWVDDSNLLALYAVYSLSDESELTFQMNIPLGNKAVGSMLQSEFGLYPYSVNIEARVYF
ncbi:MAG: hypothetical protein ACE5DZ_03220 [Mariprofundus sp.]